MKKIDTSEIMGRWMISSADGSESGGVKTIEESIQMVAEKINEIVEWINKQSSEE